MIHRFVDLIEEIVPDIPILANDGDYTIWQIGNLATPRDVPTTSVTIASGDYLADPEASPILDDDGIPTEFVYSRVHAGTGGDNEVIICDWEGTTRTTIAQSPTDNGVVGLAISLQPSWHPDGSKVLFRNSDADHINQSVPQDIRVVDRDGTNETVLYTEPTASFTPFSPLYSYDGTKIAWVEKENYLTAPTTLATRYRVKVMDADGSNVITAAGPFDLMERTLAWANTSLTIAYMTYDGDAVTDDQVWRKVNADGTGGAIVWTIDRTGRSTFDYDPPPIKWSWLSDDSAIVTAIKDFGGTDLWEVSLLDPAGTGPTQIGSLTETEGSSEDYRPAAIGGRIYFPTDDTPVTLIDSVLEDGTDQRTDLNAETQFNGFRGDNLN